MQKKVFWQKFFAFLNIYYPQTHLNKALNSLHSPRPNGRLSQNPKIGGFREMFVPENDFTIYSTVNFPKKHPDFGGLETNQRLFFFSFALLHMNSI